MRHDLKTGKRRNPDRAPVNIAINSEASIMIHRDGWYYLLVTHGSCCAGANSSYNIRKGRSRKVTGPFIDNMGVDMLQGGGMLFLGSGGRFIGPGHFGLLDLGDGGRSSPCHYEADLDRGGISVLDIRPLLSRNDWPVAGDNFTEGIYQIESARTGTALELAVEGVPVSGLRGRGGRGGRGGGGGPPASPLPPIAAQDASQVSAGWPAGQTDVRLSPYMVQAQQKWRITAVANAGGYPGAPYFKNTIDGTDRALAATAEKELTAVPAFTGAPEQLWRIDQLADGTYRVMPRTTVPRDGDRVNAGGTALTWHAVDTTDYNVNLYHFAYALNKPTSNVLFWAVTVVNAPTDLTDVRLAIGSNAASVWWVNGEEVIGIYNDRQTVIDDGVSRRLTLKRGANVIRAAVLNGGGATDFCARFLDADDRTIRTISVELPAAGR